MTSLTGSTATLRRRLLGILTATGLGGGAAVVLLSAPSAVGRGRPVCGQRGSQDHQQCDQVGG